MPLTHTWLGHESDERIGLIRARCYADKPADFPSFVERTIYDRFSPGDVLVMSDATGDVATATSLSLTMNLRGRRVACQGVAWVGTGKSHRRRKLDGNGIASHVMHALLKKARERGDVVSMLSPFRASFYERFGYGLTERQHVWTIPLELLPRVDTSGFVEITPDNQNAHFDAALHSREQQFHNTHGDIHTNADSLRFWLRDLQRKGSRFIDVQADGIASQFTLGTEYENGQAVGVVHHPWWVDDVALVRMLAMLGTLSDQYSFVRVTLPTSLRVNHLLRETQLPHRRVDHATATCSLITRMQLRVLDHEKFLSALALPAHTKGATTITIQEVEGLATTLSVVVDAGRIIAAPSTRAAEVSMSDKTWASLAMGELLADDAARCGLLTINEPRAMDVLRLFNTGPTPYCHEYF